MSPEGLSQLLVRLFDERFGGAPNGRFRISRKFLRKLAGRRKLPDAYLAEVADATFEAGFVFVDCESYSIVLSQKQFASYRRVTAVAMNKVMAFKETKDETGSGHDEGNEASGTTETEEGSVASKAKTRYLYS